MSIRKFKPTSPGRRFQSVSSFEEITRSKPNRALSKGLTKKAGRNNKGRITLRRRGGGHKRRYRLVDFRRDKIGIPGRIESVEYDPNRTARIALVLYADGERRYILAPLGLKIDDQVMSGPAADIRPGNCLPLEKIPLGTIVHNVEMRPGKGGQLVRSAGVGAQLLAKEGRYAQLRLPSGEVRMIHLVCNASIGQLGNEQSELISLGKAGRSRWLGRRPKVRGVAMNPIDHPMGGGEGKSSGGRHPVTPWGKPTKGAKTRSKKASSRYIVRRRGKSRRSR